MKVSRKAGRRSRFSVSRRRLRNKKSRSGYRKNNTKTQKGGKRGRGQKRMRARTHKRGKRFHRGGMPDECYLELGKLENKLLRYKKEGPLSTPDTKPFDATIYGCKFRTDNEIQTKKDSKNGNLIDTSCFYGDNTAKIVFVRKTEKPVTITMEFTSNGVHNERSEILSSGTAKEGEKDVKYSFDYTDNDKFYNEALYLINENKKKNKELKKNETKEKDEEKTKEMEEARKTFKDVKNKYEEMKSPDYIGDYSELSVDLFRYMNPSKQKEERTSQNMNEPVVMVNFKQFKEEQEKLANDTKEAINGSSLEQSEKDSKKSEVDNLLKRIIDNQKELMLATYFMDEAFKGEYGVKVYSENSSGNSGDQITDHRDATGRGDSTYHYVQQDIQKMKELTKGLTPAESHDTSQNTGLNDSSE